MPVAMVFLFLLVLGITVLLTLMTCDLTMVRSRCNVIIGSHNLLVKCNHHAAAVTIIAQSSLWNLLQSIGLQCFDAVGWVAGRPSGL